jgi:prevent-host-death family protein
MTRHDYHLAMNTVRIAELKAHLSEHLRSVRQGQALTVLDRNTPVARLVPFREHAGVLTIRQPASGSPGLHGVPLPRPLPGRIDVVALLLEERQSER